MSEYDIGKDMSKLNDELRKMQVLLQQIYNIVEHNITNKKLVEPPLKIEEEK